MKCTKLLIVCSLFAGAVVFAANPTPAAKDAAAAKAEAEAKRAIEKQFNELSREIDILNGQNKYSEARAACKKLLEFRNKGIAIERFNDLFNKIARDRNDKGIPNKDAAEFMKTCYETLIPLATGDTKSNWMTAYAELLQKKGMADKDTIAKLLADRYQIKDLSERGLIKLYISDNKLEKVDPIVSSAIAKCKNDNEKIDLYRFVINTLKDKKVYGSRLVLKYRKALVETAKDDDTKFVFMGELASHAKTYALMTDAEIAAYMQTAEKMKLSDNKRTNYYISKFAECQTLDELKAAVEQALASAGDNPDCVCTVMRFACPAPWSDGLHLRKNGLWYVELVKKYAPLMMKVDFFNDVMRNVISFECLTHQQKEQLFLSQLDILGKQYTIAKADAEKAQRAFDASEAAIEKAKEAMKAEKDSKKRGEMQQALNKRNNESRELRDKLNKANDNAGRLGKRLNRYYDIVGEMYNYEAVRYYEPKDPAVLKKYIAVLNQELRVFSDVQTLFATYAEIAKTAYVAQDYATVDAALVNATKSKASKEVQEYIADQRNKHKVRQLNENLARIQAIRAFVDYDNENYAEAAKAMSALLDNQDYNNLWRDAYNGIFEKTVRAYIAIEDYDGASKYFDRLINSLPWYMKDRYKGQFQELKQRVGK